MKIIEVRDITPFLGVYNFKILTFLKGGKDKKYTEVIRVCKLNKKKKLFEFSDDFLENKQKYEVLEIKELANDNSHNKENKKML